MNPFVLAMYETEFSNGWAEQRHFNESDMFGSSCNFIYIYKPWGDNEGVLEETIWSQQGKYEEASTTTWGEYKVQ